MVVNFLVLLLVALVVVDGVLVLVMLKKGIPDEKTLLLSRLDTWLHHQGWNARWGWLIVSRALAFFGILVLVSSHGVLGDLTPAVLGFFIAWSTLALLRKYLLWFADRIQVKQ